MGDLTIASGADPAGLGGGGGGWNTTSASPQSGGTGGGSGFNPLSLAVPVGAGIASYFSGQATNDANSAEAAKNRMFAADESYKAKQYDAEKTIWQATHGYQNAVDDMKKAGLNPALMFKSGGAESGSGGGGNPASAPGNPIHTNTLGQGLSSAIQSASLLNDMRNTNADIAMKQAQALNAQASAALSSSNARLTDEESAQLTSQRDATKAKAIRDAGDARWQDQNRAARMLTTSAGVGGAVMHSAEAGADLVEWLANGAPARNLREAQALEDAGIKGIPSHQYSRGQYIGR